MSKFSAGGGIPPSSPSREKTLLPDLGETVINGFQLVLQITQPEKKSIFFLKIGKITFYFQTPDLHLATKSLRYDF